ncbi:hypothetical protein B0T17DRAFT_644591 [Bombardia bombarda]|uniref:N-acetyltransferase domain-containing protein n=1 Tax=Bombardia bombarda TaxID=252184 RepID=A0AA39WHN5_9PEZI|nr:hypothetical protein B0T17DRAFT_644591 [Bombardia bombarda]
MAFVRPFKFEDTEDAKYICRATLPPSLSASAAGTRLAPYLWTLQFTHLFPQNCFVLDDGSGRTVGYVIGVPDVFAFAAAYPRYVDEVLRGEQGRRDVPVPNQLDTPEPWSTTGDGQVNEQSLVQQAYKVEWLVLDGVEGKKELVRDYRAMLHINLLPGWQAKGWGRKMIERFVESVKKVVEDGKDGEGRGVYDFGKGIQLGVAGRIQRWWRFMRRLGSGCIRG